MRIGLIAIGVVGLMAIGLATAVTGDAPESGNTAGENPISRVTTAASRGRDVKSGMAVSTSDRSMFAQGGSRDRRLGRAGRTDDPISTADLDSTRAGARANEVTTGVDRAQAYRDRQAERAERAAQIAARRAEYRNAPANANRNRAPRTNDTGPAVRDRLQDMQQARANRVTGARTVTNRSAAMIGTASGPQNAGIGGPQGPAQNAPGSETGSNSTPTTEQLLQQLLNSQAGKGNTGNTSGRGATGSGSGAGGTGSGIGTGSGSGGNVPTDTTGGGGPATIVGSGPIIVSSSGLIRANVRWIPVQTDTCQNLQGYRTNDLYLRLDGPDRLIALDSGDASTGLSATGAGFYQYAAGGDTPPDSSELAADPCAAFDSFLDFGGTSFVVLTPGGAQYGTPTSGALRATWVSLSGAVPRQNQATFSDTAYYLRIGRFTVSNAVDDLSGQILVQISPAEGGAPETLILPVPHCSDCWGGTVLPDEGDDDDDNGSGGDDGSGDDDDDDNGSGDGGDDGDNGSGGDDNDSGGDDGDDGDNGDGGSGDGGDGDDNGSGGDGGTGDDDDMPEGIEALWLPIDNTCDPTGFSGCAAPVGYATYDLYLRMAAPHFFTIFDLGDTSSGLEFGMADVWQVAGNSPPKPRPPSLPPACPCLQFDSYFAFGGGSFGFLVAPPEDQWLPPLQAVWYADLGTTVQALQQSAFADGAYYIRLMRLTIEPTAPVGGNLLAVGTVFGTGESLAVEVEIPPLP